MGNSTLIQDVKIEGVKGGVAVFGAGTYALTLNEWVALATLVYIFVQVCILIQKHYWNIKDRKNGNTRPIAQKKRAGNRR